MSKFQVILNPPDFGNVNLAHTALGRHLPATADEPVVVEGSGFYVESGHLFITQKLSGNRMASFAPGSWLRILPVKDENPATPEKE